MTGNACQSVDIESEMAESAGLVFAEITAGYAVKFRVFLAMFWMLIGQHEQDSPLNWLWLSSDVWGHTYT